MRAYAAILSVRFRALLQYRAAAVAGLATQLFWGLIRMMIFTAFYESSTVAPPMSHRQLMAYIWLTQAFFAVFPLRPDADLAELFRTGNVAYELLRPLDLYGFWYMRAIAARTAPTLLRCAPILLVASIFGWIYWPGPAGVAACAVSLLAAVLLSSAFSLLMTITLAWTISGRGIWILVSSVTWLLSGMIIPLPLYPDWAQPVLNALPFRGIIDVPFRLFTGHLPVGELPGLLAQQAAWALGLVLFGRWLLGRATRRVVIQGG